MKVIQSGSAKYIFREVTVKDIEKHKDILESLNDSDGDPGFTKVFI
nr:hypothetical protein [uncultured Flavobacterium sp.]